MADTRQHHKQRRKYRKLLDELQQRIYVLFDQHPLFTLTGSPHLLANNPIINCLCGEEETWLLSRADRADWAYFFNLFPTIAQREKMFTCLVYYFCFTMRCAISSSDAHPLRALFQELSEGIRLSHLMANHYCNYETALCVDFILYGEMLVASSDITWDEYKDICALFPSDLKIEQLVRQERKNIRSLDKNILENKVCKLPFLHALSEVNNVSLQKIMSLYNPFRNREAAFFRCMVTDRISTLLLYEGDVRVSDNIASELVPLRNALFGSAIFVSRIMKEKNCRYIEAALAYWCLQVDILHANELISNERHEVINRSIKSIAHAKQEENSVSKIGVFAQPITEYAVLLDEETDYSMPQKEKTKCSVM